MRLLVSEFMSLDGVVQAPGGKDEDTSGGFRHGGWSFDFFDPEVMGAVVDEYAERSEVLLQGRRKTLFPIDGEARKFELISVQTAKTGVQICRYRPRR